MNVVVTGGSGFIGSHVVDALVEGGHEVTVIDHRVRPHRADVNFEDIDLLDLSSVMVSTALNVMGTTNVLEAARHNGVKRVYLASTVWVYNGAPDGMPADETVPFYLNGAGHVYTSTKMACEMLCHNYGELYDLPFTVLRYGIPYGPRMREELLIPIFLKKALAGEPLTISGDGSQYRKFIYVTDIARAHLLAMEDCAKNETYNLEGDHEGARPRRRFRRQGRLGGEGGARSGLEREGQLRVGHQDHGGVVLPGVGNPDAG